MSSEPGIGSREDIESIRDSLRGLRNVVAVEDRIKNGPTGQYVQYVLYLDDAADTVRIDEIKKTQIPMLMRSKSEDYWFNSKSPVTPIVFNTGGLNPSAESNIGAHNL